MHFAFPPRKSSNPPPYAMRSVRSVPFLRKSKGQSIALLCIGVVAAIWLLSNLFGGSGSSKVRVPSGMPPVVVVTAFDPKEKDRWTQHIRRNREEYAKKHGYATFLPNATAYPLEGAPISWAKVPALRHAMTLFPYSTYFFYLDPHSLIANPSLSIEAHIMNPRRLESLMITSIPVVPPDSVIKTFGHLKGDRIDLVMTQDHEGLGRDSFVVRRGEWAHYLLDAWFDPLYRTYNFQKSDVHALEHIVQWHGTILAKLALVPQRILNAYTAKDSAVAALDGVYKDDDFIISFHTCDEEGRSCEEEMTRFAEKQAIKP